MKKKKVNINSILSIACILLSIYLIHSIYRFTEIETFIRYVIICILLLIDFFIVNKVFFHKNKKKKKKKKGKYCYTVFLVFASIIYFFLGFNLNVIYSYFSGLNKKVTYSTSLVTLKETDNIDLITLKGSKIGIISNNGSDKHYDLAQEIIKQEGLAKNNELVTYDTYTAIITALYEKEIAYAFLPSNYADIYSTSEGFENLSEKIKTITSTEKVETKSDAQLLGSSKDVSEPFTILLIGIDSTKDNLKNADSFNGDSLMIVTFNPKTMTATMLSIPRDSYVPISCFNGQYENKITHSAARGTSCVINTIQNFLDIKIDYYMKINFTGLVDLVDTLEGIEIDVPYSFCEQNSQREFGNSTIYVKAGKQVLNGEEALAFSRNRKKNSEYCSKEWTQGYRDDFVRANNQQMVVQALLNKMKGFSDISKLKEILKVISNNLDTNMTEDTIFSFYNIAKDVMLSSSNDEVLTIQKLFIDGIGQTIYDESTKLQLWNYIPNKRSVNDVVEAMKINLGLEEHTMIKSFSYSIKEGYSPKIIGEGPYSIYTSYDLLIDLTKKDLNGAQSWADKYGVKLNIEYVTSTRYENGTILSQDYPVNKRLDKIANKTITIKVVKNQNSSINHDTSKVDCLTDENNSVCKVPDFISMRKSDVTNWGSKFSNKVAIYFEYKESSNEAGTIIGQSIEEGTTVKELVEKNITITIQIAKKGENTSSGNDDNQDNEINQ